MTGDGPSSNPVWIDTAEARLCARVVGAGPPLVLLHGGPGVADYLGGSPVEDWLANSFRVCSYDQRGCRRSVSDGPFTVRANVRDLEAVRARLGAGPVTLLGHSWGALLAACYAAEFPDHVDRLVLLSPTAPDVVRRQPYLPRIEANHTPDQRARLAQIDAQLARTRDESAREALYHRRFNVSLPSYMAPGHRHKAPRIDWYSRRINVETTSDVPHFCGAPAFALGLSRLHAPTFILHGRKDVIPWDVVDELQRLIPHAGAVALDETGHFPWLETPDPCRRALLGFLGAPM